MKKMPRISLIVVLGIVSLSSLWAMESPVTYEDSELTEEQRHLSEELVRLCCLDLDVSKEQAQDLIRRGAAVNFRSPVEGIVISFTRYGPNLDEAGDLVDNRWVPSDYCYTSKDGFTALQGAIIRGNEELSLWLMNNGARVASEGVLLNGREEPLIEIVGRECKSVIGHFMGERHDLALADDVKDSRARIIAALIVFKRFDVSSDIKHEILLYLSDDLFTIMFDFVVVRKGTALPQKLKEFAFTLIPAMYYLRSEEYYRKVMKQSDSLRELLKPILETIVKDRSLATHQETLAWWRKQLKESLMKVDEC